MRAGAVIISYIRVVGNERACPCDLQPIDLPRDIASIDRMSAHGLSIGLHYRKSLLIGF